MANTKNSIYLCDDLQNYLDAESERFGMGKSAFISMVLAIYRQQVQAMSELSKFDSYMQRIELLLADKK